MRRGELRGRQAALQRMRAQGQLAGVARMLEEGRDCEDVVTQLSAVSKALDRAGFTIIASAMRQCLVESNGEDTLDVQKLQKLFLSSPDPSSSADLAAPGRG